MKKETLEKAKKKQKDKKVVMMRPENGIKMLELQSRIESELHRYLRHHAEKQETELISRANTVLFDLAQSRGVSLWKLCFEMVPQWEGSEPRLDSYRVHTTDDRDFMLEIDYELYLVPIMIDWEHGPSFWEKKYRELKEKVAGMLNEDEED